MQMQADRLEKELRLLMAQEDRLQRRYDRFRALGNPLAPPAEGGNPLAPGAVL